MLLERLELLRKTLGHLTYHTPGQQLLSSRTDKALLDVPGRKSPGIHLGRQPLQGAGPTPQLVHELGTKRLHSTPGLRDFQRHSADRGPQRLRLVAVAPAVPLALMLVVLPAN